MIDLAAAASAGIGVALAVAVACSPEPRLFAWLKQATGRWWAAERALAYGTGWGWLDRWTLVALECGAALAAAVCATAVTGLTVLSVPAAAGGASLVRAAVSARCRFLQAMRQDAVLEATRMLRQLLETGATSVNQAIAVLAERGPVPLRSEFRRIASKSIGRRQAWKEARERIGEPLFDMLAAAVLIQRLTAVSWFRSLPTSSHLSQPRKRSSARHARCSRRLVRRRASSSPCRWPSC